MKERSVQKLPHTRLGRQRTESAAYHYNKGQRSMTRTMLQQLWAEDDGVMSFEWTMLVTLLVIGVVSGIAAARDAIIDEFSDISEAALNWDQSYSLAATAILDAGGATAFTLTEQTYTDDGYSFTNCMRAGVTGQPGQDDRPS